MGTHHQRCDTRGDEQSPENAGPPDDRQAGYMHFAVRRFVVGELMSRRAIQAHRDTEHAQPNFPTEIGRAHV